jgi:hypothetical protein
MSFLDKTFCASPQCKNECGRQMTLVQKEYLKELAFKGVKASQMVSWAYFCGEPQPEGIEHD